MAISLKMYISIFVFVFFKQVNSNDKNFYRLSPSQSFTIISDLPKKKDLSTYLNALKLIVNYVTHNKKCVDFSMKFGLFLLNVNLRPFIEERRLPLETISDLAYIVGQSEKAQKFYSVKLQKLKATQPHYYNLTNMYVSMLNNEPVWSQHIVKMNLDLLKEIYSYTHLYPEWSEYLKEINDVLTTMPNPDLYNFCLASLSLNKESHATNALCVIENDCIEMLDTSANFGYPLTFKLLFLELIRLSRGCTLFSIIRDKHVRHHICKNAFREAEYIADNGFKKVDLMVEQMSLCTLDGHAQFLRKSWISAFLKHQTPYGYFSETAITSEERKKMENKKQQGVDDTGDTVSSAY